MEGQRASLREVAGEVGNDGVFVGHGREVGKGTFSKWIEREGDWNHESHEGPF